MCSEIGKIDEECFHWSFIHRTLQGGMYFHTSSASLRLCARIFSPSFQNPVCVSQTKIALPPERIDPTQSLEPAKIRVVAMKFGLVLDRESRQIGIRREISSGTGGFQKAQKER